MQPTIIKIKFTPVIKHLQKDSTKCCLEIVPDVSCIQNLDTIEWNNENKLLEYNVPVTYKIILKKDTDKNTVEKPEKIYYSCVDLRLLSTNSTMACGDITKVISDNFVLSRVTDYESRSIISKESRNVNDIKNVSLEEQPSVNVPEVLNKVCDNALSTEKGDKQTIDKNDMDVLPCPQGINAVKDEKLLKQICTEYTVSKETITDVSDVTTNTEKKRKLTITSVCTLNTIDSPVQDESKNNNPNIRLKYKPKHKIDFKISKITESFAMYRSIYPDSRRLLTKNSTRERILPELRVAHFMMNVENEILPLKILLSEIYRKCASLGFLWKSNDLSETPPTIDPTYTDKIKFLNYNDRKPKCNRVVYSIVFEE